MPFRHSHGYAEANRRRIVHAEWLAGTDTFDQETENATCFNEADAGKDPGNTRPSMSTR